MKRASKKSGDAKTSGAAVSKELAELGRRVEKALKSAAESEHVKEVRDEISKGVRNVGTRLNDALEAARASEEGRQVQQQIKKVLSSGKDSGAEAAKKMRANLSAGMQVLSQELQSLARKLGR